MKISFPEIGVCGLSCRLCPRFQSMAASRCGGCKHPSRMAVGCAFITCALKQRGVESCGLCADQANCARWQKRRQEARSQDSLVSYRALEDNIQFIAREGLAAFDQAQRQKEAVLKEMLRDFNEGRSCSYSCNAATMLDAEALAAALTEARRTAPGLDIKARAKALHAILEAAARAKGLALKLRR